MMDNKTYAREAIDLAWQDAIKKLYQVLLDSLSVAGESEAGQQTAKDRFENGMRLARQARDVAHSVL